MLSLIFSLYFATATYYTDDDVDATNIHCDSYLCNTGQPILPETCVYYQDSVFYLKPCGSIQGLSYCPPITHHGNSSCIPLPPSTFHTAWPGEPCSSNSTCAYGYCNSNNICQGLQTTESCTISDQCEPGLMCGPAGTCTVLLIDGFNYPEGSGCTSDYDCPNNSGCENSVCYRYFTREVAQYVNCTSTENWLCESLLCTNNICVDFITSDEPLPNECYSNLDCTSSVYNTQPDPVIFYSDCECGFNPYALSFCSQFPGDPLGQSFLQILKKWIHSEEINECHSVRRLSMNCMKHYWSQENYLEYAYRYFSFNNYPQTQLNDQCIEAIYTSAYYSAASAYEDYSSGAIIVIFVSYLLI